MYPLKLSAPIKDYLWGGTRLKTEYGFQTDKEKAAEAWVLSCHRDAQSVVLNGEMQGKSLPEVLGLWGAGALGSKAASFAYFPLLIKLIDAKDRLSIQVHPDDAYAMKNEGEYGKTEMWYVVDCDEGASLIYGFNRTVDSAEFERRIRDNTLTDICNTVPVKKGDVFFIASGTLHAIGKGILIAEVQQNSNTTYRVSDYGRLGADGKPRQLHIDKALEVTKTAPPDQPYGSVGEVKAVPGGSSRELACCDLFRVSLLRLETVTELSEKDSFVSLVLLDGAAEIAWGREHMSVKKGDSVFVPAGLAVTLSGNAQILVSKV